MAGLRDAPRPAHAAGSDAAITRVGTSALLCRWGREHQRPKQAQSATTTGVLSPRAGHAAACHGQALTGINRPIRAQQSGCKKQMDGLRQNQWDSLRAVQFDVLKKPYAHPY